MLLGLVSLFLGSTIGVAIAYRVFLAQTFSYMASSIITPWKSPTGRRTELITLLVLFIGFLVVYLSVIYIRQFVDSKGEKRVCFLLMYLFTLLILGFAPYAGSSDFLGNYLSVFVSIQAWLTVLLLMCGALLARKAQVVNSRGGGAAIGLWVLTAFVIIAATAMFYMPDGFIQLSLGS